MITAPRRCGTTVARHIATSPGSQIRAISDGRIVGHRGWRRQPVDPGGAGPSEPIWAGPVEARVGGEEVEGLAERHALLLGGAGGRRDNDWGSARRCRVGEKCQDLQAVLPAEEAVGPVQEGGQLGSQMGRDGEDVVAAVALVVNGEVLGAQLQVGAELGLVEYVQVEVDRPPGGALLGVGEVAGDRQVID